MARRRRDREEIAHRQRTLLSELDAGSPPLLIVAEDWDAGGYPSGWTKILLPDTWPWRMDPASNDDPYQPYFWVKSAADPGELARVLAATNAEEATFIVTPEDCSWVFAPYYAGIDIFTTDSTIRERMMREHSAWLSDRSDGR